MTQVAPHAIHPTGWFQIGWSQELASGDVVPLRYFDRDLVLYRGEDGVAHVLDAHCAHLGAHLGHGGTVTGDCVRCPFHGWTWAPDGSNVEIPYSARRNQRKTIGAWPVRERNGILFVWHDAEGRLPWWEPPTLPEHLDERFFPAAISGTKAWYGKRIQPWMLTENLVDCAHAQYVHRAPQPMQLQTMDAKIGEHYARIFHRYAYGKRRTELTPEGTTWGDLEVEAWGVGLVANRFPGYYDALQFIGVTPVDHTTSDFRVSIWVARDYGDGSDRPIGRAQAIIEEQMKVIEPDFRIWEHMQYVANPPLVSEERDSFLAMRRWSDSFHPRAPEPVEAIA